MNVYFDFSRAEDAIGLVQDTKQPLEKLQFPKKLIAKSVDALTFLALNGFLLACIENRKTHKGIAILLDTAEFKFTTKLQNNISACSESLL